MRSFFAKSFLAVTVLLHIQWYSIGIEQHGSYRAIPKIIHISKGDFQSDQQQSVKKVRTVNQLDLMRSLLILGMDHHAPGTVEGAEGMMRR